MSAKPQKVYCISCGEDVPCKAVSIGIEGEELLQCPHCGSFLGTANSPQTLSAPARPPSVAASVEDAPIEFHPDETRAGKAILPELPKAMETPGEAGGDLASDQDLFLGADSEEGPPIETVITVEDSNLISAILNDMLVAQGLTRRVISCKNGYEFLGRFVRETIGGKSRVGLVVMDVKMPVLNGISSAVAMRAHESAIEVDPIPILFFTSKRCDDTFRKVLIHCAPAMYINKGASTSPSHLEERIGKVIKQLMREEW